MQRTDFFKALGALIISPLAVKGLLKDNGSPRKYKEAEAIADETHKVLMYPYTDTGCVYIGDLYLVNHEQYMVQSFLNDEVYLVGLKPNLPDIVVKKKDLIYHPNCYPTGGQIFL